MNITDLLSKSKDAKPQGRPFEFRGVTFYFRALNRDEFTKIVGEKAILEIKNAALNMASDGQRDMQGDQVESVVRIMERVLDCDLLVGWKGLTIRIYQDIASLDLGYEDSRLDESVDLNDQDPEQRRQANELSRKMAQNIEFAAFCVNSTFAAMNQKRNEELEQKKT